jgi:hypothetical protein
LGSQELPPMPRAQGTPAWAHGHDGRPATGVIAVAAPLASPGAPGPAHRRFASPLPASQGRVCVGTCPQARGTTLTCPH